MESCCLRNPAVTGAATNLIHQKIIIQLSRSFRVVRGQTLWIDFDISIPTISGKVEFGLRASPALEPKKQQAKEGSI